MLLILHVDNCRSNLFLLIYFRPHIPLTWCHFLIYTRFHFFIMRIFVTLTLALTASARSLPKVRRQAAFDLANNGQAALTSKLCSNFFLTGAHLNRHPSVKFKTLTLNSPCTAPEDACVDNKFVQCVSGKFVTSGCAPGTVWVSYFVPVLVAMLTPTSVLVALHCPW